MTPQGDAVQVSDSTGWEVSDDDTLIVTRADDSVAAQFSKGGWTYAAFVFI